MIRCTAPLACLAALALLALATGCSTYCTDELRAALHGSITDASGKPVVPDAVTAELDGDEEPCELQGDTYSCFERGSGTYTLRIQVGQDSWSWDLEVDEDNDGCHVRPRAHDAVLTSS